MDKLLATAFLFLMSPAALAAADEAAQSAPSEPVSVFYVVVFALIFFGMIAGFFIYLFMNERKKPKE